MSITNVRVVLVRPQGSANVGAAARAMKNMGLRDLVLVAPEPLDDGWAEAMAVHGRDVLAASQRVATLAEAIADCVFVVGTAARSGPFTGQVLSPHEAAVRLLDEARSHSVALVFGPEDHGLSNEDLKGCQALVTIPTATEYASLNLAQAVLVCVYELQLAARGDVSSDVPVSEPAAAGQIGLMLERLEAALLAAGFLNPQNPDPVMNVFRRIFGRAGLAPHDVQVLLGLARQVDWLARAAAVGGSQPPRPEGDEG